MQRRPPIRSRRDFLRALAGGGVCLGFRGALFAAGAGRASPELSFGVAADAQYADADTRMGRYYRDAPGKLRDCVRAMNARKPAFTIHLGDLIDRHFVSFRTICPVFEKLSMPHYHVLGNHDFSVAAPDKPKVLGAMGVDKLGTGKGHYDFAVGRWRFVVLNGTDVSTYANPKGSEKHQRAQAMMRDLKQRKARNAAGYNGALGRKQMTWLGETLDAAAEAKQRVILFCHMPVLPSGVHCLYNDAAVLGLIDKHAGTVVAFLNGHNHKGAYGKRRGVHYLTVKGMVEAAESTYALVDVYGDRLEVTGYGLEPTRRLPVK